MQTLAPTFVAIDARHVVTHGQIGLEPDREARPIALQGVVRLLVHVAEECREAGELQIDLTPHGGAAIGVGRDVPTAALVSRRSGTAAAVPVADLGEGDHGRLRMGFEHPSDPGEEIAIDRVAVVIEADHDVRRRKSQHPIP